MNKNNKLTKNGEKQGEISFLELVNILLANLPQRSQEIVKKRFGLLSGEIETLEKIGGAYSITRERVRQIITDAVKKVSKSNNAEEFEMAEERIVLEIDKNDGIMSEEDLIRKLGRGKAAEANAVVFLAICSSKLMEVNGKDFTKHSWITSKNTLNKTKHIAVIANDILKAGGKSLMTDELVAKMLTKDQSLSKDQIINHLKVLLNISKNKFGRWGFSNWMDINPKGTRERIHLILKEKKKPLHFMEIAKIIDELGISKKKSHPQTVHNELIKDERFVLIGRGIYALKEWGYKPGTIKEVIEGILKESQHSMTKEEVIARVNELRQVKKTTIMINLNNNNNFVKIDGRYSLKR